MVKLLAVGMRSRRGNKYTCKNVQTSNATDNEVQLKIIKNKRQQYPNVVPMCTVHIIRDKGEKLQGLTLSFIYKTLWVC